MFTTRYLHAFITVGIALLALTFTACRKEEPYMGPRSVRLRARVRQERVVSRATDGYIAIDASYPSFTAGLFVHMSDNGNHCASSTMEWNSAEGSLSTSLTLELGAYTIYGYMPYSNSATLNTDTRVMTIPALPGISSSNVMVVKPAEVVVNSGVTEVAVSLQMDHLMARVTPYFYLNDAEYAALRTIKIKKVEFIHPDTKGYTAVVAYDVGGDYTTTWQEGGVAEETVTIYENYDSNSLVALGLGKANAVAHGTCYFCPEMSVAGLKIRVTYDVYDAKGNLTRPDAVAENSIKKISGKLNEATNYKLYIPLIPSYLYALSDGDLDSDALVIE